jgi:hypothetical protein
MRKIIIVSVSIVMLCTLTGWDAEACDALFVQNAKAMAFDGARLTLKQADPNIIWFCDRPVREAGHLTRDAFMELVTEGADSFTEKPPNAAVSIFSTDKDVIAVVVELYAKPITSGEDFIFPVKVLDGKLPKEGGAVSMFIDPIGRPLSPTSAAGVHRRHRRRAVR